MITFSRITMARRLVQLCVIAAMLGMPALARYNSYVASSEIDRHLEKWQGTFQGPWLTIIDDGARLLPGAQSPEAQGATRNPEVLLSYTRALRGGPWSAQLGPLSISDPLSVAEHVVATKSLIGVVLFGALLPILGTLLFGRVFCSWLCPAGFFFELTDRIRRVLPSLGIKPRQIRFQRRLKYGLLASGLVLAALVSEPVLGSIYPPAVISRELHTFVFGLFDRAEYGHMTPALEGLSWMLLGLGGIAAFEIFVSRRWWCRYVCPGGALYSLIGTARPVRVTLQPATCTSCAACTKICPMGLNPMGGEMGIECDSCGLCIAACDENSLAYGLSPLLNRATTDSPDQSSQPLGPG